MNVAANLLMEDSKVEIQEIALKMGCLLYTSDAADE